ncbi:fibrinogen C domain-containing protein 1-like [Stomoxys calcitrans]|uniref:fibrinogen C domain-containing protein 1-like n=1 Tax=Stomoxys calcitrans TaxID=35570 RepID=UPI0027E31A02|nr:fibrinogen C domain-containing protein 1-like [Stomoxys calcitrans]
MLENLQGRLNGRAYDLNRAKQHFQNLEKRIADQKKVTNGREALLNEFQTSTWTTFQRRQDGSVNFHRNWTEYKNGFGNAPQGEFFLGLQKLHELTSEAPHELLVILRDWQDDVRYAHYDHFAVGSENEKYSLMELGLYSGNAGDDLKNFKGMKFSTFDSDNDASDEFHCAELFTGGWWFESCGLSNLNGRYLKGRDSSTGVTWSEWRGEEYSLKFAEMKIRRKNVA